MIVRTPRLLALCLVVSVSSLSLPATAAIWRVNPAGTGDAPTIQAAVNAAADGDEILLADGTFTGQDNRCVDFLGKRLVVRSESGDATACIIDGEDADGSSFYLHSGEGTDTELADFTLTRMDYSDGAVRLYDSAPTVRNVRIIDSGCAIRSHAAAPTLEDVVVRDCSIPAVRFNHGAGTLTGCVLESNLARSSWGAIFAEEANLTLTGCAIRNCGHLYGGWGAGIELDECVTTIRDTEISGNSTYGIRAEYGTLTVENCTIEDHLGTGLDYSGSYGFHYELVVRDCTIRKNGSASVQAGIRAGRVTDLTVENVVFEENGAGLRIYDYSDHGMNAVVRDCDVRDNSYGGITLQYYNATLEQCTITGNGTWGGVSLFHCPLVDFRDCLIVGNAREGLGVDFSSALIERTTIAGNGGAPTGGGLVVERSSQATLRNTIVWGNCADDDTDIVVLDGCSLELSCVNVNTSRIGGAGTVLVTGTVLESDPLFCDPVSCTLVPVVGGVYRLSESSPALHQACGPMGSEEGGCTIGLRPLSWGLIKGLYR